MKTIPLTQGKITIVDDDVYEWASQMNWYALAACDSNIWYAARNVNVGKRQRIETLHRRIIGAIWKEKTDHRDGDGLNNLRSNLRICTHTENMRNRKLHRNSGSGLKGVSFEKKFHKYRARIRVNGHRIHLGMFQSPLQAAKAYNMAAVKYFGEFARPNIY